MAVTLWWRVWQQYELSTSEETAPCPVCHEPMKKGSDLMITPCAPSKGSNQKVFGCSSLRHMRRWTYVLLLLHRQDF
jgi:hypothetical protein|eukprot:COSAG01_NODE_2254_length_8070_cov_6.783743_8_plen_77_part_00